MRLEAGLKALAVHLPSDIREIRQPDGRRALRHAMPAGTDGIDLEVQVAEQAIAAAGLTPADVDLIISASFPAPALPELATATATLVAERLGMRDAAAYNLESACAGGLVALRAACMEVGLSHHRTVLVTVACPYTPIVEPGHPGEAVIGDGAYAMIVGPAGPGAAFLGSVIRQSGPTCGMVGMTTDARTASGVRLQVNGRTAGNLSDWAMTQIPSLADALFERTGLQRDDVDHWVVNAPTPAFVDRALTTLGVPPERGVNINRLVGNIGPALPGVALYYTAHLRDMAPGDTVCLLSVGSQASLCMALLTWPGDVALGPVPAGGAISVLRAFEAERLGAPGVPVPPPAVDPSPTIAAPAE